MKIEYIYEAGVFGSYKNRKKETVDKTRRELNVAALNCVVEANIDELAEVYLSMLNEIDKIVNSTFSKFLFINTSSYVLPEDSCNMRVLFNYVIDKEFKNDTKIYLNLLKHTYCNMFAAEYMSKLNEFYIPIANTNDKKYDAPQFAHAAFHNVKEFCDLITKAGKKTEKILKKYEPIIKNIVPGLPSIPTTPKFVNIDCDLNCYSRELESLYNAIGLTASSPHYSSYSKAMNVNSGTFEYPGKMKDGIHEMLNFDKIPISLDGIEFHKAYEELWNSVSSEIPYLYNKFYFANIGNVTIKKLAKDDFYSLKMLKHLIDNKVVLPNTFICILVPGVAITQLEELSVIKKFIDSNKLTNTEFVFDYIYSIMDYLTTLGKKMTPKEAEKEGIDVNKLNRSIYEFDYNDPSTLKAAATTIFNNVIKGGSSSFKQDTIDKLVKFISTVMTKVAAANPYCISSTNKILLCDFYINAKPDGNFRAELSQDDTAVSEKNNSIIIYIKIQFRVLVRDVNNKYGNQTSGKNHKLIYDKKIKLEIPL